MAAVSTIYTYDLDGSRREFTIPFEYLARRFIVITLVGANRRELVLTDEYRFITKAAIQTNRAWGPSDGYERIEVRRLTSASERLVDFADGSILRSYELNIAQIQTLHVAEEARNMVADTIGVNNDGDLDARGRHIVNLADALEPDHAVTLRQNQAWAQSALNQAILATNRADAALISQHAAKDSETKAKTSETNSLASETKAKTSETNSLASETKAKTSETNAKTSEVNAKASEVNAQAYAASVNMPPANVANALQFLRLNAAGTGFEFAPGLEGASVHLNGVSLNVDRPTGLYFCQAVTGGPFGTGYMLVIRHASLSLRLEVFWEHDAPRRVAYRIASGSATTAWDMFRTSNNTTVSTAAPSGGAAGDIWIQY